MCAAPTPRRPQRARWLFRATQHARYTHSRRTVCERRSGVRFWPLVAAARLTSEAGEKLEAGWIVMAGGATAAEALRPGINVRNTVEGLGSVSFNVLA